MNIEKNRQSDFYPPVIGWREYVEQKRRRTLQSIAAGGLALSVLFGTAANYDTIYRWQPSLIIARMAWGNQDTPSRFTGLQLLQEPYGVDVDQEITGTTVDLLIANLNKQGIKLKNSPVELKAGIVWLPEKEFLEKYIKTYGQTAGWLSSLWILDSSNTIYHSNSHLRPYLKMQNINPVDEHTIRSLKVQMIISDLLFRSYTHDKTRFMPVTIYNAQDGSSNIYNQMDGLHFKSHEKTLDQFVKIAQATATQVLLAGMPGFDQDSFIADPNDIGGMRLLRELHEQADVDLNWVVRTFIGASKVEEYLSELGRGTNNPKQSGVVKLTDLVNHSQTN